MSRKNRIAKALGEIVAIQKGVDAAVAKGIRDAGAFVPCKRGCAACCRQLMLCSIPEAMVTAIWIAQNEEAEKWFAEHGMSRLKETIGTFLGVFSNNIVEQRNRWWELKVPCPILKEDETCLVYEGRPTPCRAYLVVGEGNDCWRNGQKVWQVDTKPYVNAVASAIERANRVLRLPTFPQPFSMALWWARRALEDIDATREELEDRQRTVKVPLSLKGIG